MSLDARVTLDALRDSLAAALPGRIVVRGVRMPGAPMPGGGVMDDDALRQGVVCLAATDMGDWQTHHQREGENGTLQFVVVFYGRLPIAADDVDTEAVENLELAALSELLAWVQTVKPEPIDAVYPKSAAFSQGLDAPVAWLVLRLEALYV